MINPLQRPPLAPFYQFPCPRSKKKIKITNQLYRISVLMRVPRCITFLSSLTVFKPALPPHSVARALDETILGNLLALPRAPSSAHPLPMYPGTHVLGPWDPPVGRPQPLLQPVKHWPFTNIANKVRHKSKICSAELLPVLLYSGKSSPNVFSGKLSPRISFHLGT